MPRKAAGLSAAKASKAAPGRYGDGNGLYLLVRAQDARYWLFRYTRDGKMREMGLGSAAGRNAVSLLDARAKARKLHDAVQDGRDPLDDRAAAAAAAKAAAQDAEIRGKTFRDVADLYIAAHEASWKNAKHRQQWENTLKTYAHPHMGDVSVGDIETRHVMAALEPVWHTKPETATRLRGRIESVLDYARARGWRSGENPARWRGHVSEMLPARSKVRGVQHHAALPYDELATFMTALRSQPGIAAQALEFTILTATRTSEALEAKWGEIDLKAKLWTIPKERMKAGREHRVPLSARAIEILEELGKLPTGKQDGGPIFPGRRLTAPLSNMALAMTLRRMNRLDLTVHGFRSTFRDWAAERTSFPSEVAEMALAHAVGDKVEAAYRRGDMFEKRRRFMDAWSKFCSQDTSGQVVAIRSVGP